MPQRPSFRSPSEGPNLHVYFIINATVEEMQHLQRGTKLKGGNISFDRDVQAQPSCRVQTVSVNTLGLAVPVEHLEPSEIEQVITIL